MPRRRHLFPRCGHPRLACAQAETVQCAETRNRAAAHEIWKARHALRDLHLLAAAVQARLDQPELSIADAIENAEEIHQAANEARADPRLAAANEVGDAGPVKPEMVTDAIAPLKGLLGALLKGAVLAKGDAGTLRILP